MPVTSLLHLAGRRIPVNSLFFADEHHGDVINREFMAQVRLPRGFRRANLRAICKVCKMDGDCLCYLFQIRQFMIDCYWANEEDYQKLEDWLL